MSDLIKSLENSLASYVGTKFYILTGCGTGVLTTVISALEFKKGTEILMLSIFCYDIPFCKAFLTIFKY